MIRQPASENRWSARKKFQEHFPRNFVRSLITIIFGHFGRPAIEPLELLGRILRTWRSLFYCNFVVSPKKLQLIILSRPPSLCFPNRRCIGSNSIPQWSMVDQKDGWSRYGFGSSRWWRRRRVDPTPVAHDSTTPTRRHWKEAILDPSSRHMQAEYGYLSWILPLQIGPAPRYTQSLLIGTWDMRLEPHICVCFMFVYILNIFTITRANFDAYCKC